MKSENQAKLSTRWKIIASLLIALQLLCVFAEPFRFFTRSPRGNSPISDPARNAFAPYIEFAYLNHGYFFFAPEPGPSHLIQAELRFKEKQSQLMFPDRNAQWPRLLYHRHFMLAEFYNQVFVPPLPDNLQNATPQDQQLTANWLKDRKRFSIIQRSIENHIKQRYQAEDVTLYRIEHRLPSSDEVLGKDLALDDPRFYIPLDETPNTLQFRSSTPSPSEPQVSSRSAQTN